MKRPRPEGVAALVRGARRDPVLKAWLSPESELLVPVPSRSGETSTLTSLVVIPVASDHPTTGFQPAWGAVQWSWPSGRLLQALDLRYPPTLTAVAGEEADAHDGTWEVPVEGDREAAGRELLDRLTPLLAPDGVQTGQLSDLQASYARLLPRAAYPLYWRLAPGSREWLRPPADGEAAPTAPPAHSARVGPRLGGWVDRCRELADEYQLEQITAELVTLGQRLGVPSTRVAIIGEFGRGKSTLANRLLGRVLAPAGRPSQPLVSISWSSTERVEVRFADGRVVERPLETWSWDDPGSWSEPAAGDAVQVRVFADAPLLRSLDLELFDTPGLNDDDFSDLDLIRSTLSTCDAAFMVAAAQAPPTRTELAFLEEDVVGRHVPRVSVVVSMLDRLPPADRGQILDYIRRRTERVAPGSRLLPGPGLEGNEEAMRDLRETLAQLTGSDERRLRRSQQIAGELDRHLREMVLVAEQGLEVAALSQDKQQAAVREAEQAMERQDVDWRTVALEFEERRLTRTRQLRERLFTAREQLVDALRGELEAAPDPRAWWERDLPFRLGPQLTSVARGLDSVLEAGLEEDLTWLDTRLEQTLEPGEVLVPRGELGVGDRLQAGDVASPELKLQNIERYHRLGRLGTGIAAVTGALLFPPIAMATGIAAAIAVELKAKSMVEQQRRFLLQQIPRMIDGAIDDFSERIERRLEDLYGESLADLERRRKAWQEARRTALQRPSADGPNWQGLIDRANALRHEVQLAAAVEDDREGS